MLDYIDYTALKNSKICLLLSGGVDSSVALHLLVTNGIMPDCYYIQIGPKEEKGYDCNSDEDIEMCLWIAKKYGVSFNIIDCHDDYWKNVTGYTMESVKAGLTPNPDVMCNTLIKFGAFHDKIGYKYDYIATGHYCRTYIDSHGWKYLQTTADPVKDQTDFLCNLYGWQLQKAIFPIGHLLKSQVRQIAEDNNLINKKRKDSQGICFLGKLNYNDYVKKFLGEKNGNIIEYETNKIIGTHKGYWFHTIGQRKGLGLSGGPWYVVNKDIKNNIVYVTKDPTRLNLTSDTIYIEQPKWLGGCPGGYDIPIDGMHITFKIRHSPDYYNGVLLEKENTIYIKSETPITGIAPGQFCVIYDSDFNLVLGNAVITVKACQK